MRLSLLVRSAAMGCTVWLGAAGALAQSGYSTNGGEYAIAGALPGDQVRPNLSLSASGGYLVWEDNATCPYGLGVSALALDNSLHGVGSKFRVNKLSLGDQENPQVSLLNGGGAAFVWQGGRQSFQHIYGRFLSSNTWAGAEMLISSATNCFQRAPAVATLSGGSVAVVYSSLNQAGSGSMQDVYGQLLSPAGQKLSSEFLVNQFTAFNQRSPAIAALNGGGFVVAWVSELQRSGSPDNPSAAHLYASTNSIRPTVDIYARRFDANGLPQGNEFLVNSSSNLCAHPSLSAAADGGFLLAWAERDSQMKGTGWDVFARVFSSAGEGGAVSRVNTHVLADQYAPQTSSLGTNYCVVWTSLGQDGSLEGVYGQFLHADGSPLGGEVRVNTTTLGRQLQPVVAADGAGQFLAVWSSYNSSSHNLDLVAQKYANAGFEPAPATVQFAAPAAEIFVDVPPAPGTGPLPPSTLAGLELPFPVSGAASPLPNALAALPGSYSGLFYDTNGVSVVSAGSISAKVTPRYAYSAKLLLGGRTYSVSGRFDTTGQDSKTINRPGGLSKLLVHLQLTHLDAGADQIRGTVTDAGNWQAQVVADRLVFNRTSNKALAYAGDYTLVVPPSTGGPDGSGFGTIKIDTAGTVRWTASLADGSKLTQASTLSAQGYWPLYAPLYRGKGLITSWVQITPSAAGGRLIWIKPPGALAPLLVGSFTNSMDAAISPYSKSTAIGIFQNGNLNFSGGNLQQGLSKALILNVQGKSVSPSTSQLNVILSPSTGTFRGTTSLLSPSGRKVTFQGVLFENGMYGAGFFQNDGVSGQVYWSLP
jgi:hypothetical protein